MTTIVITGFLPFGKVKINPSSEILKVLENDYDNLQLIKVELPVVYDKCFDVLKKVILEYQPQYVIAMGVANSRKVLSIEKQAINLKKAIIPDNDGNLFNNNDEVIEGSALYLKINLDVNYFHNKLIDNNIMNNVSNNAGSYVCNNLYYHLLYNENSLHYKAIFVHLPGLSFKNIEEDLLAVRTLIRLVNCN